MMKKRHGLTLVELLIAVALGVILVGVITFVWMQSNRIFTSTVNRLETYQRLRVLLDAVERDLANTTRTTEMEWYQDTDDNGFWNAGDLLVAPGGAAAAPAYRTPADPSDPLVILGDTNEFAADIASFNNFTYFFAPFVLSPAPYAITVEDYLTEREYWRDEVMVRTFALADGVNRPALVHYRLVQPAPGQRSVLRRRMWYLDETGAMVAPPNGTDRVSLLASDVCDFKVAFYFKESAGSQTGSSQANGYWYDVGHDLGGTTAHDALVQSDQDQGYYPALKTSGAAPPAPFVPSLSDQHENYRQFINPNLPDSTAPIGNYNCAAFFYHGVARIELDQGRAMLRTIDALDKPQPTTSSPVYPAAGYGWGGTEEPAARPGSFNTYKGYDANPENTYTNFDFPGVRPGDKIFLYDATDDDGSWLETVFARDVNGDTILNDTAPGGMAGMNFPDQEYTVDVITSDGTQNYIAVRLVEPINFFRLRRNWLNIEPPFDINVPGYTPVPPFTGALANPHGPDRTVQASFNVRYRVGFLPAAFRVRLSIDDKVNKKVLPMERVIRLIQH